jgi:lipoprotein-anchoring transpeptidase ErfK/SrfK
LALVAAACGSARTHHAAKSSSPRRCAAGYRSLGNDAAAYAAVVKTRAVARRRPNGRVIARFGRLNYNRLPMIFGVRGALMNPDCSATWYRVQLPMKPNGIVGWVPASEVNVGTIRTRIVVDESKHRLTLYQDGRPVLVSRVAVGSPATPTPTGDYYVNQRLIPKDPNGPYGPAAVGVSAFSNVLTGWTRGGPIGIHGTDEPWSIGHSVSNGCIRLPNPMVRRLFKLTLSGTPVIIHA